MTVVFDNGNVEFIESLQDFSPHIREYLGLSAQRVFDTKLASELDIIQKALDTDLAAYEMSLDEYRYALIDTISGLGDIENILRDGKRLNRKELLELIKEIKNGIHKVL